jgi:hypothetical protein
MTTVDEEMTTLPAVVAAAADEEASVTKEDLPPYLLQDFEAAEGLTTEADQKRLAEHGPNEVKIVEKPVWWQIASRFLGLVPLFITTTAVLSAAIESQCSEYVYVPPRFGPCAFHYLRVTCIVRYRLPCPPDSRNSQHVFYPPFLSQRLGCLRMQRLA